MGATGPKHLSIDSFIVVRTWLPPMEAQAFSSAAAQPCESLHMLPHQLCFPRKPPL